MKKEELIEHIEKIKNEKENFIEEKKRSYEHYKPIYMFMSSVIERMFDYYDERSQLSERINFENERYEFDTQNRGYISWKIPILEIRKEDAMKIFKELNKYLSKEFPQKEKLDIDKLVENYNISQSIKAHYDELELKITKLCSEVDSLYGSNLSISKIDFYRVYEKDGVTLQFGASSRGVIYEVYKDDEEFSLRHSNFDLGFLPKIEFSEIEESLNEKLLNSIKKDLERVMRYE